MSSLADLEKQVAEHEGQMAQLDAALKEYPDNEQLLPARTELQEVLKLAQELLVTKRAALEPPAPAKKRKAEAIEKSSNGYKVGDKCEAKWSVDDVWYKATIIQIIRVDDNETVTVKFDEYNNRDTIPISDIRAPLNLPDRPNVDQMKRTDKILEVPDSLRITAEDDAETRAAKKRKIKAIKSKNRLLKMETATATKVGTWQKFQKKNKKTYKKESMFASGDAVDSKVGVTGSGKPITETSRFVTPKDLVVKKELPGLVKPE